MVRFLTTEHAWEQACREMQAFDRSMIKNFVTHEPLYSAGGGISMILVELPDVDTVAIPIRKAMARHEPTDWIDSDAGR